MCRNNKKSRSGVKPLYNLIVDRQMMVEISGMMSYEPLFRTMEKKGVTSYRLQKMGFNRATYYAIKSGKSVSTNTLHQLCKLLDCRVEDIIEYVPEQ